MIDIDADDLQFADSPVEEEQMENIATLFMSCSPGRDSEEEEDEDDSVPLSKVYGVSGIWHVLLLLLIHGLATFILCTLVLAVLLSTYGIVTV